MAELSTLIAQIVVIVTSARVIGRLFQKIRQPHVIGEMVAGILLGPSCLGFFLPSVSNWIFPPGGLSLLNALSQVGIILFMFLVGLEFDYRRIKGKERIALITSYVGIIAPFVMGIGVALFLYPRISDGSVKLTHFVLFMGTAMSITAFPVLARILDERGWLESPLGVLAISCAAVDDVTAWSILTAVVLLVRTNSPALPLWLRLSLLAIFGVLMLFVIRPLLAAFEKRWRKAGGVSQDVLALLLVLAFVSGLITEKLGVHSVIGAFLAGVIMPKSGDFTRSVLEKLKAFTVVLLLPLFFAYTGLRTSIGLVRGRDMWLYAALILLAAIIGKFGGVSVAARINGATWREAAAVGVLMNTRGLIELVVLNIGLDVGVISTTLFAMMVMMAIATTFMTAPLLDLIVPPGTSLPGSLMSDRSEASSQKRERSG